MAGTGDAARDVTVRLRDSLGSVVDSARTRRDGAFLVRAGGAGSHWLELAARGAGRSASPVFAIGATDTLMYEHEIVVPGRTPNSVWIARRERALAYGLFGDSTSGLVARTAGFGPPRVTVEVRDAVTGRPLPRAEVALVPAGSDPGAVIGAVSDSAGTATWRNVPAGWWRVVGRFVGNRPGGSPAFPVIGAGDAVHVALQLSLVQVLDEVTVMERRLQSLGLSPRVLERDVLWGEALTRVAATSRRMGDIVAALNVPGLVIGAATIGTTLTYRGSRVRVFIVDGARVGDELPEMPPEGLEALLFVPPTEAQVLFGSGGAGGALLINTRRPP